MKPQNVITLPAQADVASIIRKDFGTNTIVIECEKCTPIGDEGPSPINQVDQLIESIMTSEGLTLNGAVSRLENGHVIIDLGSGNFNPKTLCDINSQILSGRRIYARANGQKAYIKTNKISCTVFQREDSIQPEAINTLQELFDKTRIKKPE